MLNGSWYVQRGCLLLSESCVLGSRHSHRSAISFFCTLQFYSHANIFARSRGETPSPVTTPGKAISAALNGLQKSAEKLLSGQDEMKGQNRAILNNQVQIQSSAERLGEMQFQQGQTLGQQSDALAAVLTNQQGTATPSAPNHGAATTPNHGAATNRGPSAATPHNLGAGQAPAAAAATAAALMQGTPVAAAAASFYGPGPTGAAPSIPGVGPPYHNPNLYASGAPYILGAGPAYHDPAAAAAAAAAANMQGPHHRAPASAAIEGYASSNPYECTLCDSDFSTAKRKKVCFDNHKKGLACLGNQANFFVKYPEAANSNHRMLRNDFLKLKAVLRDPEKAEKIRQKSFHAEAAVDGFRALFLAD